MNIDPIDFKALPLFSEISADQLRPIVEALTERTLADGECLFSAGDRADSFFILVRGQLRLLGGDPGPLELRPPASFGELGALTGGRRRMTAVSCGSTVVLQMATARLDSLVVEHPQLGIVVYRRLAEIVAEKLQRDETRLEDMRSNLIRTQKQMKAMRDLLLESDETPLSGALYDQLQALIDRNRRVNYRVLPAAMLPARLSVDGADLPITEIARTRATVSAPPSKFAVGDDFSAVLKLAETEFAVTGRVRSIDGPRVELAFDLLIDEYAAQLEGYLSRLQMIDFVV
ncbi:MAG: cyclic nucleotide-binding domain-containing protein [Deltaproteobacteria bacterium]|nr:cyclic nucleotide-binding domain-containing protein [Deltaproteobacteria bacterium]